MRAELVEFEPVLNNNDRCLENVPWRLLILEQDTEQPFKSIRDLPQITSAIAAAFRCRNAIAEMMLDEFFDSIKGDDETVFTWYFKIKVNTDMMLICTFRAFLIWALSRNSLVHLAGIKAKFPRQLLFRLSPQPTNFGPWRQNWKRPPTKLQLPSLVTR